MAAGEIRSATLDPVPVLWQDEWLLAIHKPAGLPTLPDGYDKTALHVKSLLEAAFGRLWIVHRLDKDTSGVLLLARTAGVHRALNQQFDQHQVVKVYHALVVGSPQWDVRAIDAPLQPNGDRRHRTVPKAGGKPAVTHARVLERLGAYTLIEARPTTGRTHQIRAHLGFVAGLPLVADALYGCKILPEDWPIARVALHACALTVTHPVHGKRLAVEAPYPDDFAGALAELRERTCKLSSRAS
ncbi:MAG: RluA family pseudouridine synthase [Chloroflexota bacterium]